MFYSGAAQEGTIINEIRNYVDDNFGEIFNTQDLINHLFRNNFASNITQPLEISYEKLNDEFVVETGTFTDKMKIRPIDFFRLRNISVSRL